MNIIHEYQNGQVLFQVINLETHEFERIEYRSEFSRFELAPQSNDFIVWYIDGLIAIGSLCQLLRCPRRFIGSRVEQLQETKVLGDVTRRGGGSVFPIHLLNFPVRYVHGFAVHILKESHEDLVNQAPRFNFIPPLVLPRKRTHEIRNGKEGEDGRKVIRRQFWVYVNTEE